MLSVDDIQLLLIMLSQRTVVKPSKDFPFTISVEAMGYSDDARVSLIQAKLSVMLEAAAKARGGRG